MKNAVALRMARQHFSPKAGPDELEQLFRDMSPVATPYWYCPGSPPELRHRTEFDSTAPCFSWRTERRIVKGRFQKGSIGYVFADELPLFAALYRKAGVPTHAEEELLSLLRREGPLSVGLIREFTGMLAREITAVLHRLQQRFLVLEDQIDSEWDRCWRPMEEVFPDLSAEMPPQEEALRIVLLRYTRLNGIAYVDGARSFYQLPARKIQTAFEELAAEGKLVPFRDGYALPEDLPSLEGEELDVPRSVFVLHRNDYLVKCNENWLREVYRYPDFEVLQYLLIDGEFCGAVVGKFRNGPFDVEDIVLNLPPESWALRREEILTAVQAENPASRLMRYCGQYLK